MTNPTEAKKLAEEIHKTNSECGHYDDDNCKDNCDCQAKIKNIALAITKAEQQAKEIVAREALSVVKRPPKSMYSHKWLNGFQHVKTQLQQKMYKHLPKKQ